jgi:hypothetical protein
MRRLALFLIALSPAVSRAQVIDVQPGARVRVTAPGVVAGDLDAVVLQRVGDSLVVAQQSAAQYRRTAMRMIDVRGTHSSSARDRLVENGSGGLSELSR